MIPTKWQRLKTLRSKTDLDQDEHEELLDLEEAAERHSDHNRDIGWQPDAEFAEEHHRWLRERCL